MPRENFRPQLAQRDGLKASLKASRLWKLQQNEKFMDEKKLEAGLNASLELQCRETMEIRTNHLGAGFEAGLETGLEGLKAVEIGAKQYHKEGGFFWSSKRKKKQARKNGLPH